MYALGLSNNLVAVDTSSLFPPETVQLPKVGYFRSLSAEGVMSLNPDLIVAARGAGPEQVLQQVKTLGVELKQFEQSSYTLASWQRLIEQMGAYFEREKEASDLVQTVHSRIEELSKTRSFAEGSLNAIALLSVGQRGPVLGGKNTVPDLLMNLAGINNLASQLDGFKPFSPELLAKQRVDLILVPSHVADSMGGADSICKNQAIAMAVNDKCNVQIIDGLLLLGFGSRLHVALEKVMQSAEPMLSRR